MSETVVNQAKAALKGLPGQHTEIIINVLITRSKDQLWLLSKRMIETKTIN